MAKHKYVKKNVYEITGILDNVDDRICIVVDGEAYELEEIIKDCLGREITLKATEEE